jgi:RimJ/RimL family protein N-acetyltransferase/GNAT superfamily N-acetyltransferase
VTLKPHRVTPCDVRLETPPALDEYASVPIAFEVSEVLDAKDLAGTPSLRKVTVRREATPYVKDYPPVDLTRCSTFAATQDSRRVGGAAVERRDDLVVLWDIRVEPNTRHRGVGTALLEAVEKWAVNNDVSWLEVETQNINVPAYTFYLKNGFTVTDVRAAAYSELPDEVLILLHKRLRGPHRIPEAVETPRLVLRRWRTSEALELKNAIDSSLAHLQRWMPWAMAEPSPLEAVQQRIAKFESQFDEGREWLFAIRSRETGKVLGGTGLHPRIGPHGLEIGYWLSESDMGKGYATEAANALTRVALEQPSVTHVQIRCDPGNVPSAAIPRRLGYRHILTIENETFAATGALRDTMVWQTP